MNRASVLETEYFNKYIEELSKDDNHELTWSRDGSPDYPDVPPPRSSVFTLSGNGCVCKLTVTEASAA